MKGLLLTVDPGLRACGVSCWDGEELRWARAVRGPAKGRGPAVWGALAREVGLVVPAGSTGALLVETMKVYSGSRTDPDDLLELNGVAGAVVGVLVSRGWSVDSVEGVLARDWNGQVPSDIRRRRTQDWVESRGWSPRVDLNTTQRYQEDVWSAVGIGRWRTTGSR